MMKKRLFDLTESDVQKLKDYCNNREGCEGCQYIKFDFFDRCVADFTFEGIQRIKNYEVELPDKEQ